MIWGISALIYLEACFLLDADCFASSFEQDGVAPDAVVLADLFADTEVAEAAFFMELDAGDIFREDPGLEGPEAVVLAFGYECLQQGFTDALTTAGSVDVDTDLCYSGIYAAAGYGGESGPAKDCVVFGGD